MHLEGLRKRRRRTDLLCTPAPDHLREEKKDKKVKPKRVANEAARLESSKEEEEPFNKFFSKRKLTKPPFTSVKIIKSRRKRRRTSAVPAKK
jgi:hypothetical protein